MHENEQVFPSAGISNLYLPAKTHLGFGSIVAGISILPRATVHLLPELTLFSEFPRFCVNPMSYQHNPLWGPLLEGRAIDRSYYIQPISTQDVLCNAIPPHTHSVRSFLVR